MGISKKVYLFNLFILNIISFEVFYSSYLISNSANNAYLIFIIIYLISIILLCIFPIKNYNFINSIKNSKIMKILLSIYTLLYLTTILAYFSIILNHWFYHKTPYFLILIILSLTILIISKSIKFIFNMGAILGIILAVLNLVPIFNSIPRTFDFLLNVDFKINYLLIINSLFIYLDLMIELFFTPFLKSKISKKDVILTISSSSIVSLFLLLENYFFFNNNFLKTSYNPNYLKYKIYFINYLIDNIDVILLFNILYYAVFKGSRYLYLFRVINNIKSKGNNKLIKLTNFIILLIIFIISNSIINRLHQSRLTIINYTNILNYLIIFIYLILNIKIRRKKNEPKLLSDLD